MAAVRAETVDLQCQGDVTDCRGGGRTARTPDEAVVLDMGGWRTRVGTSSDEAPRCSFRPIVGRPRGGRVDAHAIVGDVGPLYELTAGAPKSPAEQDVVVSPDQQEMVLDYALHRLGLASNPATGTAVLTETLANPLASRSKTAELMFELYGFDELVLGWDAGFAALANGVTDGVIAHCGHTAAHMAPLVNGALQTDGAVRSRTAGHDATNYLANLISAEHSTFASLGHCTYLAAEEMKHALCYVAADYRQELSNFRSGRRDVRQVRLPSDALRHATPDAITAISFNAAANGGATTTASGEQNISEQKKRARQEGAERLRQIQAKQRQERIRQKQEWILQLERAIESVQNGDESVLDQGEYESEESLEIALHAAYASLARLLGKSEDEIYPLLKLQEEDLESEGWKRERRRQRSEKTSEDNRKKREERKRLTEQQKQQEEAEEEARIRERPQEYVDEAQKQRSDLADKLREKRDNRERRGNEQRKRQKLMAEASLGEGAGDFGANESDWEVYRQMGKSTAAEEDAEEAELEAEIARLDSKLELAGELLAGTSSAIPTASTVLVGTQQIRAPECIFQPHMIGRSQQGFAECASSVVRRFGADRAASAFYGTSTSAGGTFLCGGSSLFQGMQERLECELPSHLPWMSDGAELHVRRANDPLHDAWRGAAMVARRDDIRYNVAKRLTKHEYSEHGAFTEDIGVVSRYK